MYDLAILDRERLERGWTILKLSERCKVPEATVRQMFKRGRAHPDTVKRVARTLGYRLAELLPNNERQSRPRRTA